MMVEKLVAMLVGTMVDYLESQRAAGKVWKLAVKRVEMKESLMVG